MTINAPKQQSTGILLAANILTLLLAFSAVVAFAAGSPGAKKKSPQAVDEAPTGPAVLWLDPVDISSRDLFFGPGGQDHQPHGTFTFMEEDLNGTNPKIVVRDRDGVKWTVKLGAEARPETAATRLTWAIGYRANEDYFLRDLTIENLPPHLHRGQKLIAHDGSTHNVRLKRHLEGEKKIGNWPWRQNAFTGARELNGLRVLMALLNNWDLTDENNAIYKESSPEQVYMVSDLGSTLGGGRLTWPLAKSRGDLYEYSRSKFITKVTADYVDFRTPTRASFFFLATPREFLNKLKLRWIGRNIPRADAKWLGQLMARLSSEQIRDAFRAAGYSPQEVDGFTAVIQDRITALEDL